MGRRLALAALLAGAAACGEVRASGLESGVAQAAALRQSALALEHGEGVKQDFAAAMDLYCKAARQGDAESQYRLGWMYANGRGVKRDDAVAAYLFSLAARQGNAYAQQMLQYVGTAAAVPPCMARPTPETDEPESAELERPAPSDTRWGRLVNRLAPKYGIAPRLAYAVMRAESNFDPNAVSPRNALGLMQLLPDTALRFRVSRPFDPEQNVRGGLAYLRWLLAYFKGDVTLVAAAYNAGEGAVNRFHGVPPYPETRDYLRRVRAIFPSGRHPYDTAVVAPSPDLFPVLTTLQ
jgi:soluble lytic murein transglycosylase-like protein